jgi:hypothetical protein
VAGHMRQRQRQRLPTETRPETMTKAIHATEPKVSTETRVGDSGQLPVKETQVGDTTDTHAIESDCGQLHAKGTQIGDRGQSHAIETHVGDVARTCDRD